MCDSISTLEKYPPPAPASLPQRLVPSSALSISASLPPSLLHANARGLVGKHTQATAARSPPSLSFLDVQYRSRSLGIEEDAEEEEEEIPTHANVN